MAREAAEAELSRIAEAAEVFAAAIAQGHRWWVFGTGHSHLLAEELYGRAGGLVDVHAILEPSLMLHEGLTKSTAMERLPGLGTVLADLHGLAAGDALLVISNSGRNAVPVELAEAARERGVRVVALTSQAHTHAVTSRAPSGNKLVDVADLVIDNHGVPGDAIVPRESGPAVGAASTVVGALLMQAIAVQTVELLDARGIDVGVYESFNA